MVAGIGSVPAQNNAERTEGKCKPYLDALKAAPKVVEEFIDSILKKFKKQEKDIMYDPIPTDKPLPQKKPKTKHYER